MEFQVPSYSWRLQAVLYWSHSLVQLIGEGAFGGAGISTVEAY